ncbi:MAG: peptide chain release factor N(5)-glutamine methyltransferase [Bacteroidia bacterium]
MNFPRKKSLFYQNLTGLLGKIYATGESIAVVGLLEDFINRSEDISADSFSDANWLFVNQMAVRLLQAEPVQYVLGEAHFYGRDFRVSPAVLIPRSETEELVVWIRDDMIRRRNPTPPQILDIGTGSGCIPITLALELGDMKLQTRTTGMDISQDALDVAKVNAEKWNVSTAFVHQDIFLAQSGDFTELDVIVSNPPYVRESEKADMHKNVLEYEPETALFVSDQNPWIFYEHIIALSSEWLTSGGRLFLEINESSGPDIVSLLEKASFTGITLRRDLQGKDRMIRAEKP